MRVVCARLCRWQLGHGSHREVENKSEAYQCPFAVEFWSIIDDELDSQRF